MSAEALKVIQWLCSTGRVVGDPAYTHGEYLRHLGQEKSVNDKAARLESFRNEVMSHNGIPDSVKTSFFDYWSETSVTSNKHRWEKETSWDTKKRIMRFWKNEVTSFGKYPEKWGAFGPVEVRATGQGVLEINAGRSWNKG